jgi:hypothetical protein
MFWYNITVYSTVTISNRVYGGDWLYWLDRVYGGNRSYWLDWLDGTYRENWTYWSSRIYRINRSGWFWKHGNSRSDWCYR